MDPNHLNKYQLLSSVHGNVSVGITDSPVNKPTKQNDKENRKRSQKPKLICL